MRGPRLSIASMIAIIALIGLALGCLLYASSPWASVAVVGFYAASVASPLGIIYRRGHRRAFHIGFTLWIWAYLVGTSVPLDTGLRLGVTRFVVWAYPQMISESRQPDHSPSTVAGIPVSAMVDGQRIDDLGAEVDIHWADDNSGTLYGVLVANPRVTNAPKPGDVQLMVYLNEKQAALLWNAQMGGKKLRIVTHQAGSEPPPPVDQQSFYEVGVAVLGLLAGVTGGLVGRWFYLSREREDRTAHVGLNTDDA